MTYLASTEQNQEALHATMRAAYRSAKHNHQKALANLEEAVASAQITGDLLYRISL